jgi:hypothetical protein
LTFADRPELFHFFIDTPIVLYYQLPMNQKRSSRPDRMGHRPGLAAFGGKRPE